MPNVSARVASGAAVFGERFQKPARQFMAATMEHAQRAGAFSIQFEMYGQKRMSASIYLQPPPTRTDSEQQQQQQQPPPQQAQQQQAQQQQQGPPETTMPVTKTEAAEDCLDCMGGNPSARKLVGEEHGWCKRLEAPAQEGSAHCAGFYEEKDSSYRLCVGAGEGGCTAVGEFLDCCPGAAAARD